MMFLIKKWGLSEIEMFKYHYSLSNEISETAKKSVKINLFRILVLIKKMLLGQLVWAKPFFWRSGVINTFKNSLKNTYSWYTTF